MSEDQQITTLLLKPKKNIAKLQQMTIILAEK
jgi:hypothetical protein